MSEKFSPSESMRVWDDLGGALSDLLVDQFSSVAINSYSSAGIGEGLAKFLMDNGWVTGSPNSLNTETSLGTSERPDTL